MDNKTIFVRTDKGEDEVRNKSGDLSGDIRRALLMVDGSATFGEIGKRAAPSLRNMLEEVLKKLEKEGFIEDSAKFGKIPRMIVPTKLVTPVKKPADEGLGELDFTGIFRAPTPEMMAAEAARAKAEAEAAARAQAEARTRQQEAEAARLKAEQEAAQARAKAELAKQQAAAEARAREEAERQAREKTEAVRKKAEQEAARLRAELEAAKVKAEAAIRARAEAEKRARDEAAHLKAEQEKLQAQLVKDRAVAETKARLKAEQEAAQMRAELEAEKARIEAEAKAREEAAQRVREEAEAVRIKAQQEAEAARLKAEQEATHAREEAEHIKQEAMAEARAREEAAEAARVKAEQEAAQMRAELEAEKARIEAEAKAREEAARKESERIKQEALAEARAREEAAEAARFKAQQEAEAARLKARQEAETARIEAEAEAERIRLDAEQEALAHEEAEAMQLRAEVEAGAQQQEQAACLKAEQEAARVREEFELTRQKAEAEERAQAEVARRFLDDMQQHVPEVSEAAGEKVDQEAEALLLQSAKNMAEAAGEADRSGPGAKQAARSSSATVLFFDVVGYTKQSVKKQTRVKKQFTQVLADCLAAQVDGERIILDTGDGAAVGFLQHPEDALEVAMLFRKTVLANRHKDYPELKVRIGIHLGPINVVKDMNGQSNMVGDGINDAQRVMSFAGTDQIYVSRSYYDFISRLSDEYADLFEYRGSLKDKHEREHPVYELVDATVAAEESELPQAEEGRSPLRLEPFNIALSGEEAPTPEVALKTPEILPEVAAPASDAAESLQAVKTGETITVQGTVPPPAPLPAETAKPAAHMPSEEEVTKVAGEQARIWQEAERRAAEAARLKAEKAGQEIAERKKRKATKAKAPRIRFSTLAARMPWGKLAAGLFVTALIALFAAPYIVPTQGYATRIEQALSARLQQPVHVGKLAVRLLPVPRMELSDVSIGSAKQIKAQQARVNFTLSALFSSTKPIGSIELEGLQLDGTALPQLPAWLQKLASDAQYPVTGIILEQGKIEADGVQLTGIGGSLDFDNSGKFAGAKLHADGNKISLDIAAPAGGKAPLTLTLRDTALPGLPGLVFEELNAKGELMDGELAISDFDSHFMGGLLFGGARIDWRSGWQASGTLVAKVLALQNMNKLLEGDLDGTANFRMQAEKLSGLAQSLNLDGSFVVSKGVINGIDIVETTRLRSRESRPGGRTHFDKLSGDLLLANGSYALKQLKMSAGVLSASGTADVAKQQVSGRISAELTLRAGMGQVMLQLGGTTAGLTLRTAN
ncbi:MAG: hypothetical protein A2Z95_06305 [Gallionellales bacterium GWA2_60_18]|nr:MAG: hypothetical protein A2Z95_06305 [Gallionellales bacterium GWA2_60_18]